MKSATQNIRIIDVSRNHMRLFLFATILMSITSEISAQTSSIIGHWRRLDVYQEDSSADKQLTGDFIFKADSTYVVVGTEFQPPRDKPGWHFSGNFTGKWEMPKKKQFNLYVNEKTVPLVYKIKKLSKVDLHFQTSGKGFPVSKYKRL